MRVIKIRRWLNLFDHRLVRIHKIIVLSNNFPLLFEFTNNLEHAGDARKLALIFRAAHN